MWLQVLQVVGLFVGIPVLAFVVISAVVWRLTESSVPDGIAAVQPEGEPGANDPTGDELDGPTSDPDARDEAADDEG